MKTKISKTTSRYRQKHKAASWIWLAVATVYLILFVYIAVTFGYDFSGDATVGLLLLLFTGMIPLMGLLGTLFSDEDINVIEYVIYKYERWSFENNKYETYYVYDKKIKKARFFLNFYLYDYEEYKSTGEVFEYIKGLPQEYSSWIGYANKEDAMKEILKEIRWFISEKKADENVKIKDVSITDILSFPELVNKCEALDELKEKYKDADQDAKE